jgi:hypothetical protein
VTGAITVGVGTAQTEIQPSATAGGGATTGESTAATGSTQSTGSTGSTESTESTSTGGGGGTDFTAEKTTFKNTCGGCHALADAGTNGSVGPNLDDLKPDEQTVANQIKNGGGGMPAGLLKGEDLQAVAKYVAAVAGQS